MLVWQPNLAKNVRKYYKNGDNFSCGRDYVRGKMSEGLMSYVPKDTIYTFNTNGQSYMFGNVVQP